MINLSALMDSRPQALCEFHADRDGKHAWFLCSWHPEKNEVLEEIQAEIKLEILNSGIESVSKMEAEKWFKTLFADFHWKLHARLRKSDLSEKGISVMLGILFGQELYFVQFGRVFCALLQKNSVQCVGQNWKNFHLQTHAQLNLLGFSEAEIKVKPQRVLIGERQSLVVLPGSIATPLFNNNPDTSSIMPLLESFSSANGAMWMLLEHKSDLSKSKKRGFSRLHLSTFLLILLTLLTIAYVLFGNRFIDMLIRRARMMVSSRKPVALEKIPEYLELGNSRIIKAAQVPAKNVELEIAWATELPYKLTSTPAFNLETLYLASDNVLMAFHKRSRKLLWKVSLSADIKSMVNTRNGLILLLEDNTMLGYSDKGSQLWQQTWKAEKDYQAQYLYSHELTGDHNPRIDGSITVIPSHSGILAIDSNSGEKMSEISLREPLQYISGYDSFASCYYAVAGNSVFCINVKIQN